MHFSLAPTAQAVTAPFNWHGVLRWCLAAPALATLLAACGGGGESAVDASHYVQAAQCSARANDTPGRLLDCVTADAVQAHIERFSEIALANGGSRAAGTAGDEATAQYVASLLREAGYVVTVKRIDVESYDLSEPSVLERGGAGGAPVANDVLMHSGSGDVTAAVATPAGATGCTAADFTGFPAGSIALVLRGTCPFHEKATNAAQAGAAAVVIRNNEDGPLLGNLGPDFRLPLPVVGVSRADGEQLLAQVPGGLVLRVRVQARREKASTVNVLAETRGGDPAHVVVAGAHLDTVPGTVGSNDNGSGSAALLETALQMARVQPRDKVRFAFWGAEEMGLEGSAAYVDALTDAERSRIALYLNFDMIASPNYVYGLYVGNGEAPDSSQLPGTASETIRHVFTDYYDARGLPWRLISGADGRSDHDAFSRSGIPHGGLFTGAEESKTAQEAATWGGTAGIAYDPCYHQACDNPANINREALAVNAGLVATSVLHFAMNGLAR